MPWGGRGVAERVTHLVTEVGEHAGRIHAPPASGHVRAQRTEPAEDDPAMLGIEDGARALAPCAGVDPRQAFIPAHDHEEVVDWLRHGGARQHDPNRLQQVTEFGTP